MSSLQQERPSKLLLPKRVQASASELDMARAELVHTKEALRAAEASVLYLNSSEVGTIRHKIITRIRRHSGTLVLNVFEDFSLKGFGHLSKTPKWIY